MHSRLSSLLIFDSSGPDALYFLPGADGDFYCLRVLGGQTLMRLARRGNQSHRHGRESKRDIALLDRRCHGGYPECSDARGI